MFGWVGYLGKLVILQPQIFFFIMMMMMKVFSWYVSGRINLSEHTHGDTHVWPK